MTEAYTSLPNNLKYYGRINKNGEVVEYGAHLPFNFNLISRTNRSTKADEFQTHIESWIDGMPKGKAIQANWLVSFIVYKSSKS